MAFLVTGEVTREVVSVSDAAVADPAVVPLFQPTVPPVQFTIAGIAVEITPRGAHRRVDGASTYYFPERYVLSLPGVAAHSHLVNNMEFGGYALAQIRLETRVAPVIILREILAHLSALSEVIRAQAEAINVLLDLGAQPAGVLSAELKLVTPSEVFVVVDSHFRKCLLNPEVHGAASNYILDHGLKWCSGNP